MIQFIDKGQCCGCGACTQKCPKHCIKMKPDAEGFLYPLVDNRICNDCGLCDQVCPIRKKSEPHPPLYALSAYNIDEEIRLDSSSGGIFTMLAEKIIANHGVVFGARFSDNWQVVLDCTETKDGISAFRGSKYVQASTDGVYCKVKNFLKQDRQVLFSGTPCQIAALRTFLGNTNLSNLFTVDVLCHGVPSPLVWKDYLHIRQLKNNRGKKNTLYKVNFRDKSLGWENYCISLYNGISGNSDMFYSACFSQDEYMYAFLYNYSLRPSCFSCAFKSGRCKSDLTLADFWGYKRIHPDMETEKGISLVLVNSIKGAHLLESCSFVFQKEDINDSLKDNPVWSQCVEEPPLRPFFWRNYHGNLFSVLRKIRIRMIISSIIALFQYEINKIFACFKGKKRE